MLISSEVVHKFCIDSVVAFAKKYLSVYCLHVVQSFRFMQFREVKKTGFCSVGKFGNLCFTNQSILYIYTLYTYIPIPLYFFKQLNEWLSQLVAVFHDSHTSEANLPAISAMQSKLFSATSITTNTVSIALQNTKSVSIALRR